MSKFKQLGFGILVIGASLLGANTVVADQRVMMEEEFYETSAIDREGRLYVGGTLGKSDLDIYNEEYNAALDPDVLVTEDSGNAWDLFLGYSFNDYLSVEGYYADMGTAEVGFSDNSGAGELDYSGFGLSGILKYPLMEKLSPFVKIGYSSYKAEGTDLGVLITEDNQNGLHLGLGAEYAFNDNFAARLAYNSIDKDDAKYYGGSLVYYFGGPEEVEEFIPAPEPVAVVQPEQRLIDLSKDIFFITDKAALTTSSQRVLDEAASILNQHKHINISIGAHTDNRGSAAYNLALSERRARSAQQYLVSRGVSSSRMYAQGYGESRPIASNSTPEGLSKNRRVEIRIAR